MYGLVFASERWEQKTLKARASNMVRCRLIGSTYSVKRIFPLHIYCGIACWGWREKIFTCLAASVHTLCLLQCLLFCSYETIGNGCGVKKGLMCLPPHASCLMPIYTHTHAHSIQNKYNLFYIICVYFFPSACE